MTVLITIGIAAGCIIIGLVHRQLAGLAPVWPGLILPVLWLGTATYLLASGRLHSLVDVGGIVLAGVVIARLWHEGRQKRAARPAPTAAEV